MTRLLFVLALLVQGAVSALAQGQQEATMYKQPYCGCCEGHADHLRANGFKVTVIQTENLAAIKNKYGVPQELEGCHTLIVGGYVVEGHVSATIIRRLLRDRPARRRAQSAGGR